MNYRRLGKAGLQLSELSLGAWVTYGGQVGQEVAEECMAVAYEAGVNFFDNAESYAGGNAEIVMGNVIKKLGWRREDLVVSTKVFWGGHGRGPNNRGLSHKHIIEGMHNSLRRLQMDYVDLIFCHRPDPDTPIEETVRAMDLLIKQGKAFYWGTSEWRAADIMLADGIARRNGLTPPSMEQPQYNLLERGNFEVELAPVFEQLGFGATIWSPLASGVLTGKYNDRLPEGTRLALPDLAWLKERALAPERLQAARRLGPVAADLGCTLAQMSLAWCLKNPNVSTVITGASRVEQLRENLAALEVVPKLADDVMERIERALAGD